MSKTENQIKELADKVKSLAAKVQELDTDELVSKAQSLTGAGAAKATAVYSDVVKKGEELLDTVKGLDLDELKKLAAGLRDRAGDVESAAKDAADKVEKAAKDAADKVEKAVKDAADQVEEQVAKVTKKAPAKKAPAKKAPAKKAPAKKAAAKKPE